MIVAPGSILLNFGPNPLPFSQPPSQLKSLDVFYTRDPGSLCGGAVCLNWFPLENPSISSYRVYRSVVGFEADVSTVGALAGKTMELSVNLGPTQTVTFDGVTPTVDRINAFVSGARAVGSQVNPARFIFRADGGSAPGVVQVIGGTALPDLGIMAGTYSKESRDNIIAAVPFFPSDVSDGVEYCDPDGNVYDSYRVTTVDTSLVESRPTDYQMPTESTGKLCRVFGCVSTPSGVRVPDAEVSAKILEYPQSVVNPTFIDDEVVSTLSNAQGRFEVYLIRGSLVEFSIPGAYLRRTVRIPDAAEAALADLPVDRDYRLPLEMY